MSSASRRLLFLLSAGWLAVTAQARLGETLSDIKKSYDKQFVRDHLVALKWNQSPPAPRLPADVISRTQEKYLAALKNLLS